jgi:nuclear pore complex protein Nup93
MPSQSLILNKFLFNRIGGEVCKILPDLLLSAMEIIYKKYTSLKSKDIPKFNDGNSEEKLRFLREQAKAITVMAATVPYRMPGDSNARLIQTEILMH